MKIACIGGAGYYFLRPISDICVTPELDGCTISIYDLDLDRAKLMAITANRLSREAGATVTAEAASTLENAVQDADFVITSIGGAGATGSTGYYDSPVHLGDKVICARHGVPQVVGDTAGPAAMMAAFRSVPIHMEICRAIEKHAPNAILLNHANPMAVLCRAMNQHANLRCVIGICHGVQEGIAHVADILKVNAKELECIWIGTNHYYWFTRLRHRNRDVLPDLWRQVAAAKPKAGTEMCHDLSMIYRHWIVYPSDDHVIEFYPYTASANDIRSLPYGLSENVFVERQLPILDGDVCLDDLATNDQADSRLDILTRYEARLNQTTLPVNAEDPITGEGTGRLIADMVMGRRNVHICNIPNRGAIPNLPADALVEVEAITDSMGVRPVYAGHAPPVLEAILRKRFAWQQLVVDAAMGCDRHLALQAMLVDESALPPDRSRALLDELLAHNADHLDERWDRTR